MSATHVKHFADPFESAAEAAGLRWLAEAEPSGGVQVVRVHNEEPERIEMDRVHEGRPGLRAAARFGAALAHTHAAGADGWGTPPPTWAPEAPLRMGRSRTPFVRADAAPHTWGEFFAEYRIRDFVRRIVDQGELTAHEATVFDRVADRVEDGTLGSPQPALIGDRPARLHGDLWAGNVLWPDDPDAPTGAILIDPIAHGGHAETDLALLALFGLPHLDTVIAAYDETSPLADGWQERVSLHQLAPLLLHSLLFGGSYTGAAIRAAGVYA